MRQDLVSKHKNKHKHLVLEGLGESRRPQPLLFLALQSMLPNVLGFETVDDIIKAIQGGERIDTFERKIRTYAKTAMPDYVKGLLDEGQDLEDIVGPYKAVMVDELELPYNSVVLTDRYLQDALAKQTNLADFRRMLRRDSRWQYTDKARQEVSSAALQVLRDFGFQG